MKSTSKPYYAVRGEYPRSRWAAPFQIAFMTFTFLVLASVAVIYSLGYKYNWQTRHFAQTGIIAINTSVSGLEATVLINGKQVSDHLPVREPLLFPGEYSIEVSRPGYQSYDRIVNVVPDQVVASGSVVLLHTTDLIVSKAASALLVSPGSSDGVEVRYGSELWVDGQFITRSSQDILVAQRYSDDRHIVYQSGSQLILYDLDGGITQTILTDLPANKAISFGFKENGRVLYYKDDAGAYSAELYEKF